MMILKILNTEKIAVKLMRVLRILTDRLSLPLLIIDTNINIQIPLALMRASGIFV